MEIIGYATVIVAVPEIKELIERKSENFEAKCFTAIELSNSISSIDRIQYLAGRFAAKKAITKILNIESEESCFWLDIEIQKLSTGQPSIVLYSKFQKIAATFGIKKWLVSISHTLSYATASTIALG